MLRSLTHRLMQPRQRQQGITTLAITLILLVILTLMVVFSTSIAFFEQRTTTNENRARLAEQAAEYAVNMAGEYLKANRDRLISNKAGINGWFATGSRRWVSCAAALPFNAQHPCMSERDNGAFGSADLTQIDGRRAQLYFWKSNGNVNGGVETLPYQDLTPNAAELESTGVGGATAAFNTTTFVRALLCRIDTSLVTPACRLVPAAGNRVAVTLIGDATLRDESATATVKEIWASFSNAAPQAAVPLVAAGSVDGTGNVQIVTSPNGAGNGLPVSVWSPGNIDIDKTGGGSAASISTCHVGEFLKSTPESELKTTCATSNNACGCPVPGEPDFLSGKVPGSIPACCEAIDILDRDGGLGTNPDIQFFPGAGIDKSTVDNDDSLFEWIFGVTYEMLEAGIKGNGSAPNDFTQTTCGPGGPGTGTQNCAVYALIEDLGAKSITCAELNALGATASEVYYINDSSAGSPCALPGQVGTPESPAIVVVNDEARLNNTIFYGMLFIRSNDNTGVLRGNGSSKVFGSVVVEGRADISGGLTLVYDDTAASSDPNVLPKTARFGRVSGSWLDDRVGF